MSNKNGNSGDLGCLVIICMIFFCIHGCNGCMIQKDVGDIRKAIERMESKK